MTDDAMPDHESAADAPHRVSRRQAMQAALGGGVAAGAYLAPKIERFSVAPDYASAASCASSTNTFNRAADDCASILIGCCWGNASNSIFSCNCSGQAYSLTAGVFSVSGNITGDCNSDNGAVNFTVTGVNTNARSCTVSVSGTCTGNSGAGNVDWRSTNTVGNGTTFNQTFNGTNGSGSTLTDCNGNAASFANNGNLSIQLNCTCS